MQKNTELRLCSNLKSPLLGYRSKPLSLKGAICPRTPRYFLKTQTGTFPSSPEVKNLPCNAGDVGLIPGGGTKIPHATGRLNTRTPRTESTSHK